jgi:hypothetical protein
MESGKTTSKSFTGFHHGQSRRAEPCQGRRGESVGTLAPPQGCRRRCRTASTGLANPICFSADPNEQCRLTEACPPRSEQGEVPTFELSRSPAFK